MQEMFLIVKKQKQKQKPKKQNQKPKKQKQKQKQNKTKQKTQTNKLPQSKGLENNFPSKWSEESSWSSHCNIE